MKRLALLAALALSACNTPSHEKPLTTVEVRIPVPVPCVSDKTPHAPKTPDTPEALASADPARKIKLWRASNLILHQWVEEVGPVLEACRKN